ncbi:MAG: LysR family transcriptional regulator, partial [Bacillota bacterium]
MLHLLESFCVVAETGSLNKAAEVLHLTQPAISRQIKALEAQLGAVLLTRTPHGVELTPAGQAVLPHARAALAAVTACKHAAAGASGSGPERLRIAAGLMITLYTLPPVIAAFKEAYPAIPVELIPGHHRDTLDRLMAYKADVAFIASDVTAPETKALKLFSDPLLLVSHPQPDPPRRLADLEGRTLLVLQPQAGLRQEVERALTEHGVTCRLAEHPTVETIKTAVQLQMGVTLLPASAVREDVRTGRLAAVPVEDWPASTRTIRAFVRAEGTLPEPVRTFIHLLKEHYKE